MQIRIVGRKGKEDGAGTKDEAFARRWRNFPLETVSKTQEKIQEMQKKIFGKMFPREKKTGG